jgi:CRP/FNR family transcriptional regulator, anaerobic regulatory protein
MTKARVAPGYALQRFKAFSSLSSKGKATLAQGTSVSDCARDTIILHKGDPVSGAYLVLQGRLRVFTIAANGSEATLYFVEPGEACVLALNCLFNDLLYPAWVQADTGARVAVVPGVVYRRLFETEPGVQNLTVHALSTLVYRLMGELERVHSSNHRQRLVHFILLHASGEGVLKMTQQQIARHLGTTREVVARLISDFVAKRWVRTHRGSLSIVDLFALRAVAVGSRGC